MSIFTSRTGSPSPGIVSRPRTGWSWWWRRDHDDAHPAPILGVPHV